LQYQVIHPLYVLLDNAPKKAFDYGLAQIRMAMETVEEGTPTGRRQAINDLMGFFVTSYGPVRSPIIVSW
jgi:hypothetical protein